MPPDSLWNVELHSHTLWSKDCIVPFERIIARCKARGVDKIAITDHNTAEGALEMAKLAPNLVIVGEEIMTTQGELLGYFMTETIPARLTPEETIKRLRDQGAAISVSHPYDRLRKGAWEEADLLRILDQVDAIETFNARCVYHEDNDKAKALAAARGVRGTVGSDAHSKPEYGQATLRLPPFTSPAEFIKALESGQPNEHYSSNRVHMNSTTAKWRKKLGLNKRLWEGG
jgi:predicted metal-dependent phosphoesterase TrpH